MQLVLYTKPDCPLCEKAKALLDRLRFEYNLSLREIDITGDSKLERRFGLLVPVIELDSGPTLYGEIEEGRMRAALEAVAQEVRR
ncbi:MAG: glutaredoxin family protein [Chloroflexi bacterium]|nr:glutaredoxin family protein [Chloroflexota bacterium]